MAMNSVFSKYNLFQQVRLLLQRLRRDGIEDSTLLNERTWIVSTLSLDAPDGEVKSVNQKKVDSPVHVVAWHDGLTGAMGALPSVYSEWMIERLYRYGDKSAKEFIDIFGHRIYCLSFLAQQKYNLCALAESKNINPLENAFLSITGLINESSVKSMTSCISLFATPVRSMINLENLLYHNFGILAQITPFTGGWKNVREQELCKLGDPHKTLGNAPMIGRARLELDSHFDVSLGPMTVDESFRFFNNDDNLSKKIWICVRDYVGPVIDFSIYIIISNVVNSLQPLGTQVLGIGFSLGGNTQSHLHQVKLSIPQ